jgi:transcriptional regulator with XRE-family HTH domain
MTAFDRLKSLCDSQGISVNDLEAKLGIGKNSLYSWKKNIPKGTNLLKVADYFGVSTDYLLGRTDTPQFTRKDEKDVQKLLTDLKDGLNSKEALAYLKNDGEEIDEEDAELLAEALDFVVRQSKLIAKKKFTRKDYRKENHDNLDK